MTQKLRRRLDPQTVPPEVQGLLTEWKAIDGTDIRGTLLHDSLADDGVVHVREEMVSWSDDDAQQTSLSSDDVISRQQVDALDALINKSDTSSRLIPYLYANI